MMPRALAVDDEIVSLIVLARMLETIGFEVTQADDVPIALNALAADTFDLVVADYQMPSGTGLDLAKSATDAGSIFVLLTGFATDTNIDDPRLQLVDTHLTKPVASQELAAAVAKATEEHS